MDPAAYNDVCSVHGLTDFQQYVGCLACAEKEAAQGARAEAEAEDEKIREKKRNEKSYDVLKYKYSLRHGTRWEPMKVYLNKSHNYIRFGSDSDIEIPLNKLIVSPQKKIYGERWARNTEGHEDALVFRAEDSKFFLDNTRDLLSALEGTDYTKKTEPHFSAGGGRKKNRRKYSKKYTKRKHTKRRKSKKKNKTKRRRR